MKLLLLSLLLFSCTTARKPVYSIRATVTAIKPHQGGYFIYFRNSYREYKTYQERVPDTVFVGKVMTLPIVYRIK